MTKRQNQSQFAAVGLAGIAQKEPSLHLQWWGGVLIAALALLAYYPSLNGGFIYDDHVLLTDSPLIKAPDGWFRVWCTTNQPDYVPLTSTTLWVEWRLWGMKPTGYHVANLVLHIVACMLIWTLLRRLSIPGAYLATLLFAIHPVNVESVAWVEQRKNTLSMVLFLLSILWYLKSEPEPTASQNRLYRAGTARWYWLSLASFALAMTAKGSVAMLPLVLLLIVWWQHGQLTRRDVLRSAPFFLVSAVLTPVIIWFVTHGTGETVRDVTFVHRLLQAGSVVWFYLSKALAPIDLIFFYPMWHIQTNNLLWWLPMAATLMTTALLWWQRNSPQAAWVRPLLFAWLFYCVALAPVMGFSDPGYMRFSLVADHYQHIALLAVVALFGAGFSLWHERAAGAIRSIAPVAAVALVGTFTFLSWQQSGLYKDEIGMYEVTLKDNPECWMAHINLGTALLTSGRTQEALDHLQTAVQQEPSSGEAHHNLGNALMASGQTQEAIEQYRLALKIRPEYIKTHNNLGSALLTIGQIPEAIDQFHQTLQLDPGNAEAHCYLGNALTRSGQKAEALRQYQLAIQSDPDNAEAHNNLGSLMVQAGHLPEAVDHYRQALRSKPDYAEAHNNLAIALASTNQMPQAIEQFQLALELEPNNADARHNLGVALLGSGRPQEAVDQFVKVLQLQPNHLATYAKLTNAYVKLQRPSDAIATAEKGLALARSSGQTDLANQINDWLKKYRSEQTKPTDVAPSSSTAKPTPSR